MLLKIVLDVRTVNSLFVSFTSKSTGPICWEARAVWEAEAQQREHKEDVCRTGCDGLGWECFPAPAERAVNNQIPVCLALYKDSISGTLPGCHHEYLDDEWCKVISRGA